MKMPALALISRFRVPALLGLLLILGGCASTWEEEDIEERDLDAGYVREFTYVQYNEKTNLNTVITPPFFLRGRMGPQASLLAKWEPGDKPQYQVYLFHPLNSWAFYEGALDGDGNPLEVEFLGRVKQSDALYEERIAAYVPKARMEAAMTGTLAVDFIGRHRREAVRIPGFFVEGFLAKVNGLVRERGIDEPLDQERRERLAPEAGIIGP